MPEAIQGNQQPRAVTGLRLRGRRRCSRRSWGSRGGHSHPGVLVIVEAPRPKALEHLHLRFRRHWMTAAALAFIFAPDTVFQSQTRDQLRDALLVGLGEKGAVLVPFRVFGGQLGEALAEKGKKHRCRAWL